jgi:hypothetical protein
MDVLIVFSLSPIGHPRLWDLNPVALLGFVAFSRFHRNTRDLKDRGFVITRHAAIMPTSEFCYNMLGFVIIRTCPFPVKF